MDLLNSCYRAAECALANQPPIKLKYTADEVMAVFADASEAVQAARRMLEATQPLLAQVGLGAGAGVRQGPVVEGLIGGEDTRAYDFIGDTVNTAKRLCDAAARVANCWSRRRHAPLQRCLGACSAKSRPRASARPCSLKSLRCRTHWR